MKPGSLATFAAALLLAASGAYAIRAHHRGSAVPEVDAAELRDIAPVPRAHYGRRLEPAGNTVLHGAGQTDIQSFLDYTAAVAPARPTVFMTYVDLRDDLPAFFAKLQADLNSGEQGRVKPQFGSRIARQLIPQIGLSLNRGQATQHYESETARGADDASITQLCEGLNALHRPVFLRPGYEFNGPWNGYLPTGYVAAFRRIAARVHTCAPQVALVWDWSADAEVDAESAGNTAPAASRWQPFYPGDDAVDWWALNPFTPASLRSAASEQFLRAAAAARFPVMIAESTPKGYNLQTSATAWDDWFTPYFALIHRHPGIRAFCYINWNWAGYPQWSDWGDARIQTAPPTLQQRLRTELMRPLYAQP